MRWTIKRDLISQGLQILERITIERSGTYFGWLWILILTLIFVLVFSYGVYQDGITKRVYRFVWWILIVAGMGMLLIEKRLTWSTVACVGMFWVLQFLLFARKYGRADCYAFGCCSIFMAAWGGGMLLFLMHMLTAIVFLGIVQLAGGNIGKDGNLKKPVAFIPYIAVSFLAVFAVWIARLQNGAILL